MPWNGLGQYVLNPLYDPENNGAVIDAVRHNGRLNDLAAGLTACLAKNGENVPTANLPMGGFKHTGAAAATAAGQYATFEQISLLGQAARTAPHSNFSPITANFTVTGVGSNGQITVLQDISDVFMTLYSGIMSGVVKYVAPASVGGSDSNSGDSWASPYLTIDKALRTTLCGTIYLWPGTYDRPSYRYSDTGGATPKRVIAPFRGVTIADSGDTLSSATFTSVGGGTPNVYVATLTTANWVTRVLLSSILDENGNPLPMPKYSSIAEVDASTFGWWYDTSGTKKLYIRKGSENVNSTTKAGLSAVYATGGDNIILIHSATCYWENITFHGHANVLKLAGQAAPEGWFKNCTFKWAESNGITVTGGSAYTQDCSIIRPAADGTNYNTASGTTALGLEINLTSLYAGDVDSYGSGASQPSNPISSGMIKNASSNHDGVVVRLGGRYSGSYGPVIADTNSSYSWIVGSNIGYSYGTTTQKYGLITQGSSARAWLDSLRVGGGNSGINADDSALVNYFNAVGPRTSTNSGTFTPYNPS